jgi:hypothetical protein
MLIEDGTSDNHHQDAHWRPETRLGHNIPGSLSKATFALQAPIPIYLFARSHKRNDALVESFSRAKNDKNMPFAHLKCIAENKHLPLLSIALDQDLVVIHAALRRNWTVGTNRRSIRISLARTYRVQIIGQKKKNVIKAFLE